MLHARDDYNRFQGPLGLVPSLEPVFLLRGQDSLAWPTVLGWVDRLRAAGGDPDLIARATDQARRMRDWPVKKLPDAATRTGSQPPGCPPPEYGVGLALGTLIRLRDDGEVPADHLAWVIDQVRACLGIPEARGG